MIGIAKVTGCGYEGDFENGELKGGFPVYIKTNGKAYKVTQIGAGAFFEDNRLEKLTIPQSVNFIDAYAFYGCHNLTSIKIPEGVTAISDHAFADCGLKTINIPSSVRSISFYAFRWCSLEINIDNVIDSIEYAPWGASDSTVINWRSE